MTLSGDTSGPHIAHFHVRHHAGRIELEWEVRNAPSIRWRVLRSEQGFADSADAPGANGQVLVNESSDTFLTDEGLDSQAHYFYTVFSQERDGWTRQVEAKVRPHDRLSWFHPQAQGILDAEAAGVPRPLPLVNRGVCMRLEGD
jgi:hypothetical protein